MTAEAVSVREPEIGKIICAAEKCVNHRLYSEAGNVSVADKLFSIWLESVLLVLACSNWGIAESCSRGRHVLFCGVKTFGGVQPNTAYRVGF